MTRTGKTSIRNTRADIGSLAPTLGAVRTNCHISDAQFAADYTLCIYLLKMREYFRWEHELPFDAALPHDELTDWLTQREAHWEQLEQQDFSVIPVGSEHYDPFDAAAINAALNPLGYVYSSGYGRGMKPVFFMGALEQRDDCEGYSLLVSGRELARDLSAPPAMSRDGTIFIRRESLRRMLWERLEEWRWNRPDNALKCAIEYYDFDNAPDAALEAMTDNELRTVALHEIGEVQAGRILGPQWEELLASLGHSKAEIMLRAVRDHLADTLSTLPGLLADDNPAALHFYFGSLSNMRKELFPRLLYAYEIWKISANKHELMQLADTSATHWQMLAERLLELFRTEGPDCAPQLVAMIETHTL
ncbi:MAG: hypothetical protein OEU91_02310 [Gammaproteobacteria bacterium]|nr:hypothetical protein [Gammaproteobacteria bacterium]